MGTSVENLYSFSHKPHGLPANYGLRKHRADQSIDLELTTDATTWSGILDQAAQSQSAFDSACASEWGSLYLNLSSDDKADLRTACNNYRST